MLPERATLMMLLFLSPKNSLWRIVLTPPLKKIESRIAIYAGISRQALNNWKRGGPIGAEVDAKVFPKIKERIKGGKLDEENRFVRLNDEQRTIVTALVDNFAHIYRNSDQHEIYDAAKALHISIPDCQQFIDGVIYSYSPIFPEMYYTKESKSRTNLKRDLTRYGGFYKLWVQRAHKGQQLWLLCPLHVRYPIKIRDGFAIRCKLNFPILEPQSNKLRFWQYDGFLTVRDHALFWNFERRRTEDRMIDYFHFITSPGRNWPTSTGPLTALGTYLTTGQDPLRSIITERVILQKQSEIDNEEKRIAFMREAGRLSDKRKCQQLDQLLEKLRRTPEPDQAAS